MLIRLHRPQVEGLPELADAPKAKATKAQPKMKRIPSVPGIETDLSKAVRPFPLSFSASKGSSTSPGHHEACTSTSRPAPIGVQMRNRAELECYSLPVAGISV